MPVRHTYPDFIKVNYCKTHKIYSKMLIDISYSSAFCSFQVILTGWCGFTLAASEQSNMVIHKMVQMSCRGPVDDAGASASGGWTGAEMLPILF